MLSKRSNPLIEKLTGSSVSGTGIRLVDGATSPRSPLEMKSTIQSPRGLKSYDLGGVGLGIVAALEKSDNIGCDFYAKKPLYHRNSNRSKPIPVNSAKLSTKSQRDSEELEMGSLEEEYTFVTCRGPDNKPYTRVYRDGGEQEGCRREVDKAVLFDSSRSDQKSKSSGIFYDISPPKFGDFSAYPTSDFLSSCHLCQKKLHGRDIYMYRGEKAFCSPECRYRQIVMDERKEKCRSGAASRSLDLSTSPYTSDQIFSTGILAI